MWLWFLCLAFMGDAFKTIVIAPTPPPPPPPSLCNTPAGAAIQTTGSNWTYIGSKGGIETYVKHTEGSDLLAFRGVAYIDAHISQAIGPFMNLSMSHEWVSMLKHIQKYPINKTNTDSAGGNSKQRSILEPDDEDMIYQILELPWPLMPRDVLMHRKFSYDSRERTVTINYHSVEDERCPITSQRVRAHSPQSMWRFRSVPSCGSLSPIQPSSIARLAIPIAAPIRKWNIVNDMANIGRRMLLPIAGKGTFQVSVRFANNDMLRKAPQRVYLPVKSSFSMPVRITLRFGAKVTKPPMLKAPPSQPLQQQCSSRKPHRNSLAELQCSPDKSTNVAKEPQTENSAVCARDLNTIGGTPVTNSCWRGVGTIIEFESFVDSKAAVPAWFINYMQRSFPAQALSAYKSLAAQQRTAPLERVLDW